MMSCCNLKEGQCKTGYLRSEWSPPEYCRPSVGVSRLDMQKKGKDKVVEVVTMIFAGILNSRPPNHLVAVLNSVGGFAGHFGAKHLA